MRYLVSYDLDKRCQSHDALWNRLEQLDGQRVLLSQWIVKQDFTDAAGLIDHLRQFIHGADRLLVVRLEGAEFACWNALVDPNSA